MPQQTETQPSNCNTYPVKPNALCHRVLFINLRDQIIQKVLSQKWRRRFWNWLLRDAFVRLYQFVTSQVIRFLREV